jgi:hypothetical protein
MLFRHGLSANQFNANASRKAKQKPPVASEIAIGFE